MLKEQRKARYLDHGSERDHAYLQTWRNQCPVPLQCVRLSTGLHGACDPRAAAGFQCSTRESNWNRKDIMLALCNVSMARKSFPGCSCYDREGYVNPRRFLDIPRDQQTETPHNIICFPYPQSAPASHQGTKSDLLQAKNDNSWFKRANVHSQGCAAYAGKGTNTGLPCYLQRKIM